MMSRFSIRAMLIVLPLSAAVNAAALGVARAHDYIDRGLDVAFALLMVGNLPALPLIAVVPAFTGTPEQGVSDHPMWPGILWTLAIAGPPLNALIAGGVIPALKRY